jgi:uncharacterized spore protein YtfJ
MSANVTTPATAPPGPAPPRRVADVLFGLAERLGGRVTASTVYAPPVEREGVTVSPVATARFVVGGGSGSDPEKGQEGGGGGGLGRVAPAGYIELNDGRIAGQPNDASDSPATRVVAPYTALP